MEMGLYLTLVWKASCWPWDEAVFPSDSLSPTPTILELGHTAPSHPTPSCYPSHRSRPRLPSIDIEGGFLPLWGFGGPRMLALGPLGTSSFTTLPSTNERNVLAALSNIRGHRDYSEPLPLLSSFEVWR